MYLVLLVLVISVGLASSQSCTFPGRTLATLSDVKKCVGAIPLTDSIQKATIDTISDSLLLYAFRDIVNSPPESPLLHVSVDISERLKAIRESPFFSQWSFFQAINNVFIDLKDPHTVFIKPNLCYDFFFLLGIELGSRVENGQQVVFISGSQNTDIFPQYAKFANMTVLTIDGADGVDAVSAFSTQSLFISKDPGSLFNSAIQGGFTQRYAGYTDFPVSNNVTFVLAQPNGQNMTVVFPWYVFPRGNLQIDPTTCSAISMSLHEKKLVAEEQARARNSKIPPWRKNGIHPSVFEFRHKKTARPDISFTNISDHTMLLQITTFEPEDNDAFMKVLTDGIAFASQYNINQLLIDLSGNGGGDICLGYAVIEQLLNEKHPVGSYDVIHSPLSASLANTAASPKYKTTNSLFTPSEWNTLRGQKFLSSDWYWGLETSKYYYTRGNKMSTYSSPMELACPPPPPKIDSTVFSSAILMTDGLCGSTCAVFSSHIAKVDHVKSLVVGGFAQYQKQQYFSFPGGLVYNLDALLSDVATLGLDGYPYVPQELPAGGRVTFTLLEIYPWDQDTWATPLEFVYEPADLILPNWCFTDDCRPELYRQVQKYFNAVN